MDGSGQRGYVRPLLALLVLAAGVALFLLTGAWKCFTAENIEQVRAFVRATGMWGPLVFILLCVVASLFFAPAIPLLLVAGVFGALKGTLYASIGLTLGASASFLLSRYSLRPFIEDFVRRNPFFKRIDAGVKHLGWRMVLITRLVPIFPYSPTNFAYGLTGISFATYAFVSWLCMLPPIIAYVFISGSLISGKGDIRRTLLYLAVAGCTLAALSLAPAWLRKRYRAEVPPPEEDVKG